MLKDKLYSTLPPEDNVIRPKEHTEPSQSKPSNVKSFQGLRSKRPTLRVIAALVFIAIVIIGLLVYFVPIPRQIQMNIQGAEVDKDGNIIATGNFVLEARYNDYLLQQDTFELTNLSLPNAEIIYTSTWMTPPIVDDSLLDELGMIFTFGAVIFDNFNGIPNYSPSGFLRICMPPDFSFIVIKAENRLFVGSTAENPNYINLIAQCDFLIN